MGCLRDIQTSAAWARPYMGGQPLNVTNMEPALTAANLVKQTVLGAPFTWPWNRNTVSFTCDAANKRQDYAVSAPGFGFVESWLLTDAQGNVKEIENRRRLTRESAVDRPASAAVQLSDNSGNLTARLNNVPDQAYTVELTYQYRALPMMSLGSRWDPIPDEYAYIVDWGFLSIVSLLVRDDRYPIFRQSFLAHLLGAQDGLDATQRNIFLGTFLDNLRQAERSQSITQQASQGRQF